MQSGGRCAWVARSARRRDRHQGRFHGAHGRVSRHQGTRLLQFSYRHPPSLGSSRHRRRTQSDDPRQDLPEHPPRHRDLRHLERDIAAVADHLRADLDQLYTKRDQLRLRVRCGPPAPPPGWSAAWGEADQIRGKAEVAARRSAPEGEADVPATPSELRFLAISGLTPLRNSIAIWHIAMPVGGAVHCIRNRPAAFGGTSTVAPAATSKRWNAGVARQ